MTTWLIWTLPQRKALRHSKLRQGESVINVGKFSAIDGGMLLMWCIIAVTKHLVLSHRWHDSRLCQGTFGQDNNTKAIEFHYHCAQDTQIKGLPHKTIDSSKHQDWQSMVFFDCQSHLNITLQVVNQMLTAKIDLKCMDDHIPYHTTTVTPEAIEYISENQSKQMGDVSTYHY